MTPSRHTVCERCVQVRGRKPSSSDNADGVSTTPKTKRSRANSNPQIFSCTTVLVFVATWVVTYTQAHVALSQYICTHVCTQTCRTTQHARTAVALPYPPPRPAQKRTPCPIPCDQLRILTRDGQATSDHAYTRVHVVRMHACAHTSIPNNATRTHVLHWRATPTPTGRAPLGTRRGGRAGRRNLCPLERATSARKGGRRFKLRTPTRRREPRGPPGGPPQRILYKFCAALIVTVASIGNTKGWAGASDGT